MLCHLPEPSKIKYKPGTELGASDSEPRALSTSQVPITELMGSKLTTSDPHQAMAR